MSKLKKLPNIQAAFNSSFQSSGAIAAPLKVTRASTKKDYRNRLKTLQVNQLGVNKGTLRLEPAFSNIYNGSGSSVLANSPAISGHNAEKVFASDAVRTMDGRVPTALRYIQNVPSSPNVAFWQFIQPSARIYDNRYLFSVLVKLSDKYKGSTRVYLRVINSAVSNALVLNDVYLEKDGVTVNDNSSNYPQVAPTQGVEFLDDGWAWLWVACDTVANVSDASNVRCMEIGFNVATNITPVAGDIIAYIDLPYMGVQSAPVMSPPIESGSASCAADVLNLGTPLLNNELLNLYFKPHDYVRTLYINGVEVSVGAEDEKLSLYRQGNQIQAYVAGDYRNTITYSNNAEVSLSTSASIDIVNIQKFSGAFMPENISALIWSNPGLLNTFSKALLNPITIPAEGVGKTAWEIIERATGLDMSSETTTISKFPGAFFLEIGLTTTFRLKAVAGTDWDGYVDFRIVGSVIDGVPSWTISLAGGLAHGCFINTPIARIQGIHDPSMSAQVNSYHYDIINNQYELTVAAGDKLVYEIYSPVDNAPVGFDAEVIGGNDPAFRHYDRPEVMNPPIRDQNGISPHPAGNNGGLANRRWYRRVFDLSAMAGMRMRNWSIVLEAESNGPSIVYIRNAMILNASGAMKGSILTDHVVTPEPITWTGGGSVNYRNIVKAILTPAEAVGVVPLI